MILDYHDVTIRVRYAETDQMGVVYHSNYLIWFEVGRVELMREHPAKYDELLTVRTRILEAKNRTLKFGYELLRQADQKLLATGHTIHVACNRAGHVKHFPEKYKVAFLSLAAPQA